MVASRPAPARAAGSRCRRRPRRTSSSRSSSAIVGRKRSALQAVRLQPVGRVVRRHHEHDAVRRTAPSAGGRGSSRRRCPTTWNSSKQTSRQRCAMRAATVASGSASRFSVASSAWTSRMNAWKWTRVLRRIGTVAKKRPSGSSCRARRRPRGRRRAGPSGGANRRFSVDCRAARNAASSSASCSQPVAAPRACACVERRAPRRRAIGSRLDDRHPRRIMRQRGDASAGRSRRAIDAAHVGAVPDGVHAATPSQAPRGRVRG